MKIHGTAKGGALSTKDFGVAFGGGNGDVCGDFDDAGGTLTPSSGSSTVLTTQALGITAGSTWILRFSVVFATYDAFTYWHACLSNNDGNDATSQNEMGCLWRKQAGAYNNFGVHNVEGANPNSVNSTDQTTFTNNNTSKYYWEIIRQGETSCKINFYGTDSSYSTVTSDSEDTSTNNVTDLNRIKFFTNAATAVTGSIVIDDVYFCNNVTSPP